MSSLTNRAAAVIALLGLGVAIRATPIQRLGLETAISEHLRDGSEPRLPLADLLNHGRDLFQALWTVQEGGGRPASKGTGASLSDPSDLLVFPRNFNRISAPDANSCLGCHNLPLPGGAGDVVTNAFVLGERFDFATFDRGSVIPTKSSFDEKGNAVDMGTFSNPRNPPSLFGSGLIELLARQMTVELRQVRDRIPPGSSAELLTKGISFGTLSREPSGAWNTAGVVGLAAPSLVSTGPNDPPGLEIRPFHQAGAAVSLRQFTVGAFNQHHGIQATERFGDNTDPDGDGFRNELTRADVTAAVLFQATLPTPGRIIPDNPEIEQAVLRGEESFTAIGCAGCHIPALPLDNAGWIFQEPGPFNPPGTGTGASSVAVDLTSDQLPGPRLKPQGGVVFVPAFTDLKLHDITSGPNDPNREPLDMNQPAGSPGFFAGNGRFLTRKLWSVASEPPFFHHGRFTTMRQAVLAHNGEAAASKAAFLSLGAGRQDAVIEFLKTLRILPPGTTALVVNERGQPKAWPPR